ncbi:unnamed protein product [Lactuca saligna]|uniref:Uncharacterized protein n=1 Tax=Lactuca saligna TaxID=75948 RepID=A0AA35YIQ8_LACSI|nr:unnamed protein product [Lactuca saligna]
MAKRISKKTKKIKKRQLVIPMQSSEEEEVPKTPKATPIIEPSSPEKTTVIPPEDSSAKSFHEEVRTSYITTRVSETDVNVNMGEGDLHQEEPKSSQGTPVVLPIKTVSSAFVSLPPYIIPTTSTTESPTFENIINQPFTSILSSQSTDPPRSMEESKNERGFGGTFETLEFDDEEEDFPDHMLMSMKQFKIMNKKMNSIIQSQADMGGSSSVSSFELDGLMKAFEARMVSKVSGMLKDTESRILEKLDHTDQKTELRVNSLYSKFVGAVKEFKNVQKERHTLFVLDVIKVREDVNFKLQELRDDMVKEVDSVKKDYATRQKKVDIICDAVIKYAKLYESLSPQISQLSTSDSQQFGGGSFIIKGNKRLGAQACFVFDYYPEVPILKNFSV